MEAHLIAPLNNLLERPRLMNEPQGSVVVAQTEQESTSRNSQPDTVLIVARVIPANYLEAVLAQFTGSGFKKKVETKLKRDFPLINAMLENPCPEGTQAVLLVEGDENESYSV